uniref:hypothetical protein n=1 Tax=Actinoplanes sp. CA-151224 TaxID=3239904 RepID=UPI003F49894A
MAKRVGEMRTNSYGEVTSRQVHTRKVGRIKEVDWPVTLVLTRGQRIARKLWG